MLKEIPLPSSDAVFPKELEQFAAEAIRRSKKIDCFDFVPSSYPTIYRALSVSPRGRFCELGSGMGVVTAMAAWLGFDATGIEIDEQLAAAARTLLSEYAPQIPHGAGDLRAARILAGDYFATIVPADLYFVYCWPSQIDRVEQLFDDQAPDDARLLICYGAEDVRCKVRAAPDEIVDVGD